LINVLLDLEISMIKNLQWNLNDLDQTDAVSLFDFIRRVNETGGEAPEVKKKSYCDEVSWM